MDFSKSTKVHWWGEIMKFIAHKSYVGFIKRAENDGTLTMFDWEFPYKKGELIFTSLKGDKYIISERQYENDFVEIKIVEKTATQKDSFVDEYIRALKEFRLNQEENKDYIESLKKLISNKQF